MSVDTYYTQLMEYMAEMPIIDSHEHLPSEQGRLAQTPDFSMMFCHYCTADLLAAGMSRGDVQRFTGSTLSVAEKWQLFAPYYHSIQDGSYCRAAHLAIKQFYGCDRLTSPDDAEALTLAMRAANTPGLYRRVLQDACHIRLSLNYGMVDVDPTYFAPVAYIGNFADVSRETIRGMEDRLEMSCSSLQGYLEAVRRDIETYTAKGNKGFKFGHAYARDLHFAPRTTAEAEQVYNRIIEEGYGWRPVTLGYNEVRPLQDYLTHRLMEMAEEYDMPVVFHTGLQTNELHNADNARPLRLWNLPHRYRRVKFILLHAGFPWLEDAALLAKHYPNVYLDMAWTHLMSPELSTRALEAWVDLVPMSKIIGFGADQGVVEKVWGHLQLAKQDIARALANKITRDSMPPARAQAWIQAMLYENPQRIFKLEL